MNAKKNVLMFVVCLFAVVLSLVTFSVGVSSLGSNTNSQSIADGGSPFPWPMPPQHHHQLVAV